MNNIKNYFSIVDFENLSGIKAHTIRIWEKRYQMFQPIRHGNNERLYELDDLKKLLNIKFLQENGWKISKIAVLKSIEIQAKVNELVAEKGKNNEAFNQFKLAMLTFDQDLFNQTYQKLLEIYSFREIFYDFFIPLLDLIGVLWQTGTIIPAHEHFISQLIENKLHLNAEKVQNLPKKHKRTFVLFLPENEVHNLGILYVQYELLLKGCKTIYLGGSVPLEDLKILQSFFSPIVFVTLFTVSPALDELEEYMVSLKNILLNNEKNECWISGRKVDDITNLMTGKQVKTFLSLQELINNI